MKFTGKVKPARTALSVEDPLFGMTLSWWDSNVEFTVPFRVTDPAEARIICKISYMACDGSSCRPHNRKYLSTCQNNQMRTKLLAVFAAIMAFAASSLRGSTAVARRVDS